VLDGKLNITEMPDFDRRSYVLINFDGAVTDNGLEIGKASDLYAYDIDIVPLFVKPGGYVRLNVLGEKQWNGKESGDWNDDRNWVGPVPNEPGARANFLSGLDGKGAVGTVAMNGDKTVGRMKFDSTSSYEIIGKDTLQFDNAGNGVLVEVESGKHSIGVPITVLDHTEVYVSENHFLAAPAGIKVGAGKVLKKTGEGALDTGPIDLAAAAKLNVNQGVLQAVYVRGASATIRADALVQIARNGTAGGTSKLDELVIEGTTNAWEGRLDLRDNDLIVQSNERERLSVLSRVYNQVKTARNSELFLWSGNGIGTSSAQRNPLVGLAVALNDNGNGTPMVATFGGQAVDANSVLVKFTYNGDANLDGRINADDYFRIDSGFLAQLRGPTYRDGDFNYDAKINADDYFLIDSAFLGQGAPLDGGGNGAALAAVSVPEPSGFALAIIAGGALLRRRRRAD
jgi:hypothetical protein